MALICTSLRFLWLIPWVLSAALAPKQVYFSKPSQSKALEATPVVRLRFRRSEPIPNMPGSLAVTLPVHCRDSILYLDSIKPSDPTEHVIYGIGGKAATVFPVAAITDLKSVKVEAAFPGPSYLGILVRGKRVSEKESSAPYYISLFNPNGQFEHSVPISVDHAISHFGMLPDKFLVVGYDRVSRRAKLDLLNLDGTFLRSIDIPAARVSAQTPGADSVPHVLEQDQMLGSLMMSAYGDSVLVWRAGSRDPVVEVRSNGAVREVPLQIPEGYTLAEMVSSTGNWIARVGTKSFPDPESESVNSRYYTINPADGTLVSRLEMSREDGNLIVCEADNVYTSFEMDAVQRLRLLTSY